MKHNRLFTLSLALTTGLLFTCFSVWPGGAPSVAKTANNSAAPNAVPSGPGDWPQWRGPERNGISKDTGLLKQWPSSGPQQSWSISNLGEGYGSIAIKGRCMFAPGTRRKLRLIFGLYPHAA